MDTLSIFGNNILTFMLALCLYYVLPRSIVGIARTIIVFLMVLLVIVLKAEYGG